MNQEELIQKWLQDDLNPQELAAFKALDDYDALMKLSENLMHFKAPKFDASVAYETISAEISKNPESKTKWLKPILRMAALIAISFSVYYYTTTLDTHISTLTAEKTTIELPDYSEVTLNSQSQITYNKKSWKNQRELTLNGEAYFKVEKGSKFNVQTASGTITVLGTQFLVENRNDIFEVVCYEGSVQVTTDHKNMVLKPGDQFLILDGKFIAQEKENNLDPAWLHNESQFKSMPYKFVLNELERQYKLKVDAKTINTSVLFTGKFVHTDLELALKAITLPLNITYTKENGLIVLHEK
ncbi:MULTISPECIES: FecR family protein [Bizionia]|uniref:FecR family protein n=1 Tax=Bizionia algoritergicola TaxID=291187 RepID=A0A5D0QUP5_9FLAO|nr:MULTISPECIES: FecR family protein [Bizionia]OBX21915.1 anti-sigma factor [Bizionia sp. APA-3]TYB71914.1 FecR family protein [Bizionia algoritergicola]